MQWGCWEREQQKGTQTNRRLGVKGREADRAGKDSEAAGVQGQKQIHTAQYVDNRLSSTVYILWPLLSVNTITACLSSAAQARTQPTTGMNTLATAVLVV